MSREDALSELVLAAEDIVDLLNRWELVRQNSYAHTRLRDAISALKKEANETE